MVTVIVNPVSGATRADEGRRRAEQALAVVTGCGEEVEVFLTERRGHARELAGRAVARGARLVLAWGGDGTMNEVASVLVSTPTALGLIPSGSGNGLARDLGVARNPPQAIKDAVKASPRSIDAGELGGRYFFSMAGIGFDAHVAACFDRDPTGRRGLRGYARIVAREFFRYKESSYCIDADPANREAFLLTIANSSQFGNGARVAPGAILDDGYLDLVVFEEPSRLARLLAIPHLFTGTVAGVRGMTTRRIERAVITSRQPMIFHVDGEPAVGGTRLEACIHPLALKVCVK